MTKIVNLDELAAPDREVTYKGASYKVLDLSFSQFLNFQSKIASMSEKDAAGKHDDAVADATAAVAIAVPGLESHVGDLNVAQLGKLLTLISSIGPEPVVDAQADKSGNA